MRFSFIATLCAAPLVLASNLQHDLAGRGIITPEFAERSSELVVNRKEITIVQAKSEEIIIIWTNDGNGAATKTVTETKTVAQVAGATAAAAAQATHTVVVGGAAGKVYTPETVNAAIGDMIVFNFEMANHTLTQSAFTTPCEKLATGGMDSGFVPNSTPAMAMQVMVDTPQWFYCRQAGHCGSGMVFSINPTADKTQAQFKAMAVAQNGTGTQSAIQGGSSAGGASSGTSSSAVASAAAAISTATVASGTGTVGTDGTCSCSCLCGQAAFPNAAVQGVGMFGGVSGAMSMSLLEK
ncbi:putative serine-threonine rich protein [Botrytis fragariae]|uniref:Putative serine-threonine rich protein n=1 Tax=Botrytis fragariae TaxID=1964551 RepID=A0A8H6ALM7_9HELO|nr:putative serine-threonine rich protein [Botrytis fragariae]KAF5869861.1 putative serine-threonine rich protein [Botrytis fragariae]